jgi:limonene-1,2-epoxide hydrolase
MEQMKWFVGMVEEIEFEVHHLASDGSTVLVERTDHITSNGRTASLRCAGAFDVVDGKITAWREYFDTAQADAISGDDWKPPV